MKRTDLKPCIGCGHGMMHDNGISFFRMRLDYLVVDLRAIQQIHGMEMMMGSPVLAHVMGPNPDVASEVSESDVLVCLPCATTKTLGELWQLAGKEYEEEP